MHMSIVSLRSFLTPVRVLASQQRLAGHAKWQNIAHTKNANDIKKGQKVNKFCLAIRRAAAGSPDPKINDKLRDVIAQAVKANVPRSTIERQIERAANVKVKKELVELMGPGGSFLLLDIETDNISRTRHDLKKILKQVKGAGVIGIMREGAAKHAFMEKGVIVIAKKDNTGKVIDKERIEEIAIEAGAEEVLMQDVDQEELAEDEEGNDVATWTLYTEARELFTVKGNIEKLKDISILEAEVRFLPIVYVPLSPADLTVAASLCENLRAMDDVNTIYDNIKESS